MTSRTLVAPVRAGRRLAGSVNRRLKRNGLLWRYWYNLSPTVRYRLRAPALSEEAFRVAGELDRNGIAMSSVEALLRTDSCFPELAAYLDRLEREMAPQIAAWRANADQPPVKSYIATLLGTPPRLDPGSVCARFALQPAILGIADRYFGMWTRLYNYNFWHNFVVTGSPRGAHLWHNDEGDRYMLKLFLYLNDVDEATGPLVFARGTHPKGNIRRRPTPLTVGEEGKVSQSTDGQMAEVVPQERWVTCVGPKGTMIFWDPSGFHKGGLCRGRERLLYTCMFTSRAGPRVVFARPPHMAAAGDARRAFALGLER